MDTIYRIELVPIANSDEIAITVDYKRGNGISSDIIKRYHRSEIQLARKELIELRKKNRTTKLPIRLSSALTKKEREVIEECKKQKVEYKTNLINSRCNMVKLNIKTLEKEMK